MSRAAALLACAEAVRRGDPDRFAATMATPAPLRDRLWPLYAVNLELARAPWASAEPMVGEMRLQWWIDALDRFAAGGPVPAHEYGPALEGLEAPARALIALAEARRADCWPAPFADVTGLWAYLDQGAGSLVWAAGLALGAGPEAEMRLRAFGAGAGLAGLFLAWPELQARARPVLSDPAPGTLAGLAREGLARLSVGRGATRGGAARAALLPGWQARAVLTRAAADPGRILRGDLALSEFARRAGLLRAAFFGL